MSWHGLHRLWMQSPFAHPPPAAPLHLPSGFWSMAGHLCLVIAHHVPAVCPQSWDCGHTWVWVSPGCATFNKSPTLSGHQFCLQRWRGNWFCLLLMMSHCPVTAGQVDILRKPWKTTLPMAPPCSAPVRLDGFCSPSGSQPSEPRNGACDLAQCFLQLGML